LSWATWTLFYSKLLACGIGYAYLLRYIWFGLQHPGISR
jgi:hypothetical protein